MKFKSDIEVQAGLRDGSNDIGTAGQLLSSTGTITNWIDQSEVVAAGATRVLIACKNTSGGTLTKGTPVYQTGNVGATDVIEIAEADALISTGYLPAIGLLETDLINNASGHVVITGELLNITTDPIDGLTPTTGDTIYLKSGGGLTLTKPTGEGNAIQNLGLVGKVSGGNSGSLTVASIMRQNDVPNLPTGKIWIGDGNTIVSDTVYVDEPNNRVGIGTTSPSTVLEVSSTGVNGVDISQSASNASQSGRLFFTTNTASEGFALFNSNGTFQVNSGGIPNNTSGTNRISIIGSSGNVGIGTTSPAKKLTIGGIGIGNTDGLKIEDPSNTAYGAHFSFDDGSTTVEIGGVTNNTLNDCISIARDATRTITIDTSERVGIGTTTPGYKLDVSGDAYIDETLNIETTISGTLTYGYGGVGAGNLVVGGLNFASFTPAVITLMNQDTSISAGQDLGVLQFGGKDDVTNGYANGQIICTTAGTAGTGNTGGGIFRFLLSGNTTGSGPTERMRITNTGNVGIGTTSPSEKLEVNGTVKATASTDAYKGYIKQTIATIANEKGTATANYNFIPYNTLTTVNSNQYYNRMTAAYDGRIKKVYIVNTGGVTPDATVVNFKKQVNNVTSSTVYSATVANAGSAGMSAYYDFADNDFTFNEGDIFGILYQTTDSGGGARKMAGVAINIIVEYNIT